MRNEGGRGHSEEKVQPVHHSWRQIPSLLLPGDTPALGLAPLVLVPLRCWPRLCQLGKCFPPCVPGSFQSFLHHSLCPGGTQG